MTKFRMFTVLAAALLMLASVGAAAELSGSYVEARNAEVYASHCFANAELGLRGELAVMGWQVDQGSFNNVKLDGLSVVAVIKASRTLGDPFTTPYPIESVMVVDERATGEQRQALTAMARHLSNDLIGTVKRTETAPITLDFHGNMHARKATLTAGEIVKIETRAIKGSDSLCHLDDLYYAPLAELDHAMPAFTLENRFSGQGLGVTFSAPRRSSAYLGTFTVRPVAAD